MAGQRGQGHIRPKGRNRWEISAPAGTDPVTGRSRRKWRVVTGTKDDAVRALRALQNEIDRTHARGSDATLAALIAEYLRLTRLAPTTRAQYELVRPALGKLGGQPIWKVRARDLDHLYAAMADGPWNVHSVIRLHTLVSAALGRAVKWGWVGRNVARDATPPAAPHRLIQRPEPDVVARLLDGAGPEFAVFLAVAFSTGARRGELVGLQWGDIDDRTVQFRRNVVYTPASGLVVKDTKSGREREVVIDADTAAILAGHRADMAAMLLAPIGPATFVFTSDPAGRKPWRPDYATYRFDRLRRQLGLPAVKLHHLRHAAATYALRAGFEVTVVSRRLGHSRPSITTDVYGGAMAGRDEAVADSLAGMLRLGQTDHLPD